MSTDIRRGSARFTTRSDGMVTQHAFSFGEHYDPERLRFGPMVCHDEHFLGAGRGFETHRHRDLEILTWVLSGRLRHEDSTGASAVIEPGTVGLFSPGAGVEHSEHATADGPCRFVQVWLTADEDSAAAPSYDARPVPLVTGELVEVARPRSGAVFSVARLEAQQTLTLPEAPLVHAYVATGALTRSSLAEPLSAGDAFLFTDEPAHTVTAAVPTELLVWTFAG